MAQDLGHGWAEAWWDVVMARLGEHELQSAMISFTSLNLRQYVNHNKLFLTVTLVKTGQSLWMGAQRQLLPTKWVTRRTSLL